MGSVLGDDDVDRFRQKAEAKSQAKLATDIDARELVQAEKRQQRLAELVGTNSTLPVTISSVTVLNARNTRRGLLESLFNPLLSVNDNSFYTLTEALNAVSKSIGRLERFDIFEPPISLYIDRPDPTNPKTTPTDLDVYITPVRERSPFQISSGTWAGSNDGSVYLNVLLRNVFGGAETFNANASYGTRTKSAYSAGFDAPILNNPDLRLEIGALQSATQKNWASHEERLRGGFSKFNWLGEGGSRHEFGYSSMWRQNTGLAEKASPTIRADAGDSFKSSLSHTWIHDRRDYALLPTKGYLMKTVTEVAGFGALKGDVAFGKFEAETQTATPIPIPGIAGDSGISFTTSLRGGVLYPLPLGGESSPSQSRINDRFFLGGPTDVRGFRFSGLGPRDGADAVGGDVYAAGGASLLFPLPRVSKEVPLRIQAFVNAGRLLALKDSRSGSKDSSTMTSKEVSNSVQATVAELGNGLPSCAAGIGLVYALPVARFELNFSLPLVMRKGEEARKGLSLGVGLTFL